MTDPLHEEDLREDLTVLAARAQVPRLDMAALERSARRHRLRRRLPAAGLCLALLTISPIVISRTRHTDDQLESGTSSQGTATSPTQPALNCRPAPATAAPDGLQPGGTVTLRAPAAPCALGDQTGKTYQVNVLIFPTGSTTGQARDLGPVQVNLDGSFTVTLKLPSDLPTGTGTFFLYGSPADTCGAGGSCASYSARPSVEITNAP